VDATLFDFAADRLEQHTGLDRLEARGTLRIALKSAGLEAKNVTGAQMRVVFEQVMPGELGSRGVADIQVVCAAVIADLADDNGAAADDSAASPDEIFSRLARG